jgi:small subunit ribosomal protein S4
MTKRVEAKHKLDRRMGQNIWGRPKSPVNRREYGPGQHGQRRKGKLSDFGVQLRAKQKLKGYYANISEKQFRGVYAEAIRMKGDSGANLIGLLERRLDAVIYRAKFVPTVFAARQFINHGHVKVNGRRVNIPSFQMKVGDLVEVKDKSKQLGLVLEATGLAERDGEARARADADRGAVPGADGAASGSRVLLAVTERGRPARPLLENAGGHARTPASCRSGLRTCP